MVDMISMNNAAVSERHSKQVRCKDHDSTGQKCPVGAKGHKTAQLLCQQSHITASC